MENRNMQGRTLLPHQRKIWTEAFKASMHHTSIESAERKAWQAVDICERVGAFGEASPIDERTNNPQNYFGYTEAWQALIIWFSTDEGTESLTIGNPHQLVELLDRFGTGSISIGEFKKQLKEIDSFA